VGRDKIREGSEVMDITGQKGATKRKRARGRERASERARGKE
jgi:hypothetical protein